MRADRLVAILMLLQTRGQVTAIEVAEELEVSERTARRDLEALGMAGLPVYSVQGRGGGWRLLGGGKTDLSGLSADEARALFLVAGPSTTTSPDLRAALRKLVRALPEPLRSGAEAASTAVVVDAASWGVDRPQRPPPPQLDAVQRAVIEGEQLRLGYVARDRSSTVRDVHPLGLAAKGSVWYLVADTAAGIRTFRVDRISSAEQTGEPVVRPDGFDLADVWREIRERVDQLRTSVTARALAHPEYVGICRWVFGTRLGIGSALPDGRVQIDLRAHHVQELAWELAGFGGAVEVLDPPELRERLAGVGAQLVETYGAGAAHAG